jgi:hypothetical protein
LVRPHHEDGLPVGVQAGSPGPARHLLVLAVSELGQTHEGGANNDAASRQVDPGRQRACAAEDAQGTAEKGLLQ